MNAVAQERPPREKHVHCSRCDALCCRLTVTVFPEDDVPAYLTSRDARGVLIMARDAEGWCVALDGAKMNCGIYETRPAICRKFAMAGPYCLDIRAEARGAEARNADAHSTETRNADARDAASRDARAHTASPAYRRGRAIPMTLSQRPGDHDVE